MDVDDELLAKARAELGTSTIKDTINEARKRTSENREERVSEAPDTLASAQIEDGSAAWR